MKRFWAYLAARVVDMVRAAVNAIVFFSFFWLLAQSFGPTITLTTSQGDVIITTD